MKQISSVWLSRLSVGVFVLAFMVAFLCVASPVRAQGAGSSPPSSPAVTEKAVDANTAKDAETATAVFEQDKTAEKDKETQDNVELESLRGLPYLTIEDTLRYKRELVGEVEPLKPEVSLMFTSWEHALLREMKQKIAVARPATASETNAKSNDGKPRPKGIREISLGGIVFADKDDWTIWLNNQRVTPDAIPKEILDMRVTKDYVKMKWFDGYTNLVFPLRLRPHQRFNLDNRIFLPGTAEGAM